MKNKWILGIWIVLSALLTVTVASETYRPDSCYVLPSSDVCHISQAQPLRKAVAKIHRVYKLLTGDLIHNDYSQTQTDKNLFKTVCSLMEHLQKYPSCIGKLSSHHTTIPLQYKDSLYVYRLHKILI